MVKRLMSFAFKKSLWVYHTNAGACNGCDIEVINILTPYYDAERFGIKLVGSPRYADALLISGPVTRQVVPALNRLYDSVPDQKIVIAVGSCAAGGGIWYDSYNVLGGVDRVIDVDYFIPGCPPRPEAIIHGVALALGLVKKKLEPEKLKKENLHRWLIS